MMKKRTKKWETAMRQKNEIYYIQYFSLFFFINELFISKSIYNKYIIITF